MSKPQNDKRNDSWWLAAEPFDNHKRDIFGSILSHVRRDSRQWDDRRGLKSTPATVAEYVADTFVCSPVDSHVSRAYR